MDYILYDNHLKSQNPDLHGLFIALAKIMSEFNLEYDQFVKTLRRYYVLEAHKKCKTIAKTSLKCGVDRRFVSEIVKDKEKPYPISSLHEILNQIELIAKSNNMIVNKQGEQSVQSIMHELACGATTLNSIIQQLIAQDCIEDFGESIRMLNNGFDNNDNIVLRHISAMFDEYINTLFNRLLVA